MTEGMVETLAVAPVEGCAPDIGQALWALEDARGRTLEALAGLREETLDWRPPAGGNPVGTLLYHIAAIELDWLYVEVLQAPEPWPEEVTRFFPVEVRDEHGALTRLGGEPLSAHLARLYAARAGLLATLRRDPPAPFPRRGSVARFRGTP